MSSKLMNSSMACLGAATKAKLRKCPWGSSLSGRVVRQASRGSPLRKKWYKSFFTGTSMVLRTEEVPVSRSTSTVGATRAKAKEKFTAKVLFPTPPLPELTVRMRLAFIGCR
ncbi:MAG: hypothetical protein KatS3mg007_0155 [Thermoanaerobaculum sp.]|nr:MAG: hypothetical protein KatS3mg007_0155 [Thermoanaerobaculum sp.]